MNKLLMIIAALTAALALAPASFAAACADCDPGGGGGGTVNVAPTAAFSFAPGYVISADNVTFTNASTDADGSIVSSSWDFKDGGTSTLTSPVHVFAQGGTYEVTLTVTDNDGAQSSVSHTVTVQNRIPTAFFTAVEVVLVGQDLDLSDESWDPEGASLAHGWTFGDGTTSTAASPAKSYSAPGTYEVKLTVTDDWEAISSYTRYIRVDAPPTTQIVVVPNQTTGAPVQFDSTSADSDGTVASYAWDFGDGTNGTGPTPAHSYAQAGSYQVKLVVTDNDGATGSSEVTVNVADVQANTGDGSGTGGGTNTAGGSTVGGTTGIPTEPLPGTETGGSLDKTAPALVVPAKLKAKKKAGNLTYVVSTNEAATIVAKLTGKVAGSATVKITKAGSGKVVIKLSSKAKKALRAAKSMKLTLITTATDAAGNKTTKTTKVTLV